MGFDRQLRLSLALLLLCALPLRAETWKWVDEKGVTNYSSAPPASRAAKVIEERVSVVPADPSLVAAIADMRAQAAKRAEYIELEWLQRQRLMAAQPVVAPVIYDPYIYPYAPVFVVGGVRAIRPGLMPVFAAGPMRPGRGPGGRR